MLNKVKFDKYVICDNYAFVFLPYLKISLIIGSLYNSFVIEFYWFKFSLGVDWSFFKEEN